MGIFKSRDDYKDAQQATANAAASVDNYYGQAQGYMNPYTSNASQDFNTARQATYGAMQNMQAQGNPNAGAYKALSMGPAALLGKAESGYSMDPATSQKMKYGESAAQNALNAEGLYGSGEGDMEMAEIGSTIYSQGEQQYLKNLMGTVDKQLKILGIDDDQRASVMNAFGKEIGLEAKSSTKMADLAQRSGETQARAYENQARISEQQARSESQRQPIMQLASLASGGLGTYKLAQDGFFGGGSKGTTSGGGGLWYMDDPEKGILY